MRYPVFLLAVLFSCGIYAQQSPLSLNANTEKYNFLRANSYYQDTPLVKIKDSMDRLQKAALAVGNDELSGSIKLLIYDKESREHLVSDDTTVYRILKLAADAHEKNLKRLEADALQVLADRYKENKQQQSAAIEQYMAAYALYRNFNYTIFPNKQDYMYHLGLILYLYEDYSNSLIYLYEALATKTGTNNNLSCQIATTIGMDYRKIQLYDSAIIYFKRAYDSAVQQKQEVWVGISEGNIGICYFHKNEYAKAEPLLKKDIESSIASTNIRNAVTSLTVLATIYCAQGKYGEAEKLLLRAQSLASPKAFWHEYTIAKKIYEQLYIVYGKKKQYRLSYLYGDSALRASDSAVSRNNTAILAKAYEKQNFIKKKLVDEKIQNDAILKKVVNDKLQIEQQQLLYKFIIGFLIVVLMVAIIVNRYRTNLREISTSVQDSAEIVVQKMSIVLISIATCAAALVWTALYYYYYGFCLITILPFTYFLAVGPALIIYFFTKKPQLLVNVQLCCIFFITVMIEVASGGFKGGIVILWAFLAPAGALIYKGLKHAAVWMALFIIAIIGIALVHEHLSAYFHPIPETAQFMFNCMNILGPGIVIYFSMQFFVKSVIRDGRLLQENNLVLSNTLGELKHEKQKSDDLLLNILPAEIAEELKAKGTTTARHYDNVTVLFTDFVNFTKASENMGAQALIDELHTCFKVFDDITAKYNIEKIKTIGDAYLAVCGLPTADAKHAENIVGAAIEIIRYMQARQAKLGNNAFKIRIGIHSGSVVAGIVGVKKFAYDIWGDTVNTAARMEQNSESGKINISQTAYELVKDKFPCTYRGEIEAKGKGVMKMYFVEA